MYNIIMALITVKIIHILVTIHVILLSYHDNNIIYYILLNIFIKFICKFKIKLNVIVIKVKPK